MDYVKYLMKNKEITKAAQLIFGKDVVKAGYNVHDECILNQKSKEKIKAILTQKTKEIWCFNNLKQINIDVNDGIVIEMNNGNMVHFSNSEWSRISSVSKEDVIKL